MDQVGSWARDLISVGRLLFTGFLGFNLTRVSVAERFD